MSEENPSRELVYNLQKPIEYHYKGEVCNASFVSLVAPTSKHLAECADLKQYFFRSLPQNQDSNEEEGDGDLSSLDGDAIMTLISMSTTVELKSVLLTAKQLFKGGVAMLDGEVKMTSPLLDAMDMDDLTLMTGTYMVNFILASSLIRLKENSQKS